MEHRVRHQLINCEMAVYFVNIGLVQQLTGMEKLVSAYGELETRVEVFSLYQNTCVLRCHFFLLQGSHFFKIFLPYGGLGAQNVPDWSPCVGGLPGRRILLLGSITALKR